MVRSYLEDAFDLWLQSRPAMPVNQFVKEFQFAPPRKWRFDFAWPVCRVAVEIEGLRYDGKARHQTAKGFMDDAEKYEAALRWGWKVYRVPGPWVADSEERMIWRPAGYGDAQGIVGDEWIISASASIALLIYRIDGPMPCAVKSMAVGGMLGHKYSGPRSMGTRRDGTGSTITHIPKSG